MAAKRKIKERVQNYCSLFPELGAEYGSSHTPPKKTNGSHQKPQAGKRKGAAPSSRERRNKRLWESLFPSPRKQPEKGGEKPALFGFTSEDTPERDG